MSAEPAEFDHGPTDHPVPHGPTDHPVPEASTETLLESLTDWALQINQRERGVNRNTQETPQEPSGPRQGQVGEPRVERHLGRHRSDS